MNEPADFRKTVLRTIKKIPKGKVASYGQVAALAGKPRAAREVGWILNSTENNHKIKIPWWRVINNKGLITIKGTKFLDKDLQKALLVSEGIEVDKNYEIDIEKYRWSFKI